MTREAARKRLSEILAEAVEFENSVCYVTEEDREPLETAIKALEQEPCEDAISRQAVLDTMKERDEELSSICPRDIRELPSVTPQTKTGHWIRVDKDKLKCSECEVIHLIVQYPQSAKIDYCPNCGAKMQEVQE